MAFFCVEEPKVPAAVQQPVAVELVRAVKRE
jgi:hypothetical protein